MNQTDKIRARLLADGISEDWVGFDYLVKAIELYRLKIVLSTELYPAVARATNATPAGVSRGIHNAIAAAGLDTTAGDYLFRTAIEVRRKERAE